MCRAVLQSHHQAAKRGTEQPEISYFASWAWQPSKSWVPSSLSKESDPWTGFELSVQVAIQLQGISPESLEGSRLG